jgi:ankyrin repeat protein
VPSAEGDEDCCEVLLEAGADVNAVGGPYGTPLQAAAWAEDMESVRVLLKAGADITITEPISGEYGTALQAACAAGSFDIVQELLQHGAAVNIRPANGKFGGALSAAAAGGFEKIVKLLIKHHADVNASGGLHGFPILAAAQSGVLPVVKRLLDHGANASALGGLLGSTVTAAVYGNNLDVLRLLVEHGADVHAKGGKYGNALQTAVMKADVSIIDELLDQALELVHHQGGKYHTALIAASYFNRVDVVGKLLNTADLRVQGGIYRSAITAASIRGNKTILEKFLVLGPPDHLLDEALVEACAYRQSACVDALLKAGANVYSRHATRGSAIEALDAPEEEGYNSDLDDDDNEDEESEDDEEEETEDDEWEGDNVSVAGQTDEGSVTDLELEEELSEEAKIRKLLKEAQDRCKRNPTVKRFRTVKHREIPTSLSVGLHSRRPVPPLPPTAELVSSSIHGDATEFGPIYGQLPQEPWSLPFHLRSGGVEAQARASNLVSPPPVPSYAGYPAPLFAQGKVQSPPSSPERMRSPMEDRQRQYSAPSLASERHNSAGSISSVPQPNSTPLRKGSADHALKRQSKAVNRKSVANLEALSRYHQQRQSSYMPPLDRSISEHDYATPGHQAVSPPAQYGPPPTAPQDNYTGPRNQSYPPPLPQQQSQQFDQPQQWMYQGPPQQQYPYHASTPPPPPPVQQSYVPYHQSAASSPASIQSSQYTRTSSQYAPWDTPNSSTSTFSNAHSQGEAQGRRWASGGYDGEGYG